MKTILITGGCGFIGSNFIRFMLDTYDYTIVNLDALTYAGNPDNLREISGNPRYTFVHERIENRPAVEKILHDHAIDTVIHFAAESHVDRSIADCAPFVTTNVVGTQVLLDASRAHGLEKFIHISTDEVYGSLGPTGQFLETTPIEPNSPYSASKAASDLLVRSFVHTHKFPALIVRCSNNYGPYQFPEKFIPLALSNALREEPIPLYGDGLNVRDWIYVEDFCSAIAAAAHNGKVGEVYNAGGNAQMRNIDVLTGILEYLGKPKSLIKFVTDRPGHDRRYAMNTEKIGRELGWKPAYDFQTGIARTIEWYQKNEPWWQRVKSGAYRDYYKNMYGERINKGQTYATGA